jgi:hypothetical protein
LLAYQYLQTLPQLAQGAGNTFWVIPSEVTSALRSVASAFGGGGAETTAGPPAGTRTQGQARREPPAVPAAGGAPAIDPAPAAASAAPAATTASPAPAAATATTAASPAAASPDITSGLGPGAVSGMSEAVSAMLAAAIPGSNFVDPLGSIDPAGSQPDATANGDADLPSPNGTEAEG